MTNYKRIILLFTILALLTVLSFLVYKQSKKEFEIDEYKSISSSLNAKEVLSKHLYFKKEQKLHLFKLTVTEKHNRVSFITDDSQHFEVLTINEIGYDNLAKNYLSNTSNFYDITSFEVLFDTKVSNITQESYDTFAWRYILVKETEKSPWLVYDWGVNF